jgi:hypothetical protein
MLIAHGNINMSTLIGPTLRRSSITLQENLELLLKLHCAEIRRLQNANSSVGVKVTTANCHFILRQHQCFVGGLTKRRFDCPFYSLNGLVILCHNRVVQIRSCNLDDSGIQAPSLRRLVSGIAKASIKEPRSLDNHFHARSTQRIFFDSVY